MYEMDEFVQYLVGNYNVEGCTSIEKRYTHSMKITIDKSENERIDHSVGVALRFFDKDNELLLSDSIKFVNNLLTAASKKKLKNISDKELENRFMRAKNSILNIIKDGYMDKITDLNVKIGELHRYLGKDTVGCNAEFSGEHIELKETERKKNKAVFDM